jgi:hypothetical protein
VLLGLFCEVNTTVLLSAFTAVGAHSATAYWDQAYAEDRRRVSPVEQHVHSLLEVSPLTAAFLLTVLHWDQALAAVGRGRARFGLRLKHRDPLPVSARVWLLTAVAAFGVVPTPKSYGGAGARPRLWHPCRSPPWPPRRRCAFRPGEAVPPRKQETIHRPAIRREMSITAHRRVTTAEAALNSPGTYLAEMVSSVSRGRRRRSPPAGPAGG